jgi:hypothetical protein
MARSGLPRHFGDPLSTHPGCPRLSPCGCAIRPSAVSEVGRTPWSARVPLDPLSAQQNQPHASTERPTGGSAADQGVRPTLSARRFWVSDRSSSCRRTGKCRTTEPRRSDLECRVPRK